MMQKFDGQDRMERETIREERAVPRLRLRIEELETRIAPDVAGDPLPPVGEPIPPGP
jgi:hypothetical protein